MHDLYKAYLHSFALNEERDADFFSHIRDIYFTDEIQGMAIYPQHGQINRLQHIMSVTYVAYVWALKSGVDVHQTLRGALLHDLFYYDWHQADDGSHRLHGYRHPGFAAVNARALCPDLTKKEESIIRRHMWPLTPTPPSSKEGFIVSGADKYCAAQEVLMSIFCSYFKRIERDIAQL